MTNKIILIMMLLTCLSIPAQKKEIGEKILVVYFSHSGNTRTVTEQITRSTPEPTCSKYNPKKPIPPTTIQSWIKLKKR